MRFCSEVPLKPWFGGRFVCVDCPETIYLSSEGRVHIHQIGVDRRVSWLTQEIEGHRRRGRNERLGVLFDWGNGVEGRCLCLCCSVDLRFVP